MFLGSGYYEFSDAFRNLIPFMQLKNVNNTHGGVLNLVKSQASSNFTKSNSRPWVFFTFLKLYKRHQISRNVSNILGKVEHWIKVKRESEAKIET